MSVCRRPDYEQSDELGVKISGLGSMPMWLSVHPSGAWAYTVDMSGDGSVHAHAVSPLSGALTPINSQPSRGSGPCHLTATQNFVLCANYSGGTISVLPIEANGGLGPAVEYKDHGTTQGSGAGVHVRQDMAHPHQILLDPSGKRCYVPDLGTNKVHAYLWNADTGVLTEPSELLLHDGAGPRHMCFSPVTSRIFLCLKADQKLPVTLTLPSPFASLFSPVGFAHRFSLCTALQDGAHAYILGELDNSVSVCTHADGKFKVIQTLNSLVPGTEHATAGGAAEIIISPDGRFVYATIRGTRAVAADPYPTNYAFNTIGKCRSLASCFENLWALVMVRRWPCLQLHLR